MAALPPDAAVCALRGHPRLQEAVRAAVNGHVATYSRNGLLNRVINDRGRLVGGMIALYLHLSPTPGGTDAGLTVGRFQAFCVDLEVCSPGRARAMLALMRLAGYLAPAPGAADRRLRRLVPTEHLIEVHRQRWERQFEAMALVMPVRHAVPEVRRRPEFLAVFVRRLGASYLAGFRPLHYAPELARLAESNAGLLVVSSLFLSAVDSPLATPTGTTVPVSIYALAARFGVARAHARKLLADAEAAGLVRRADGSGTVVVLPRLVHAVGNFFAAAFALLAHGAEAAAEEIGGVHPGAVSIAPIRTRPDVST